MALFRERRHRALAVGFQTHGVTPIEPIEQLEAVAALVENSASAPSGASP